MTAAEGFYQNTKASFEAQEAAGKTFFKTQADLILSQINKFYSYPSNIDSITEKWQRDDLIRRLSLLTSADPVTSTKTIAPYKAVVFGDNIPTMPDPILNAFNIAKWKPFLIAGGVLVSSWVLGYLIEQINKLLKR